MSASDPLGGNKFWFNGVPFSGVAKSGDTTAGLKYWFNGVPMDVLFQAAETRTFAVFSIPQRDGQVIGRMVGY